jgi:hypothetical protein
MVEKIILAKKNHLKIIFFIYIENDVKNDINYLVNNPSKLLLK